MAESLLFSLVLCMLRFCLRHVMTCVIWRLNFLRSPRWIMMSASWQSLHFTSASSSRLRCCPQRSASRASRTSRMVTLRQRTSGQVFVYMYTMYKATFYMSIYVNLSVCIYMSLLSLCGCCMGHAWVVHFGNRASRMIVLLYSGLRYKICTI